MLLENDVLEGGHLVTIVIDDTAYHQVNDVTQLHLAIERAEENGMHDVFQIAQGAYTSSFTYDSTESFDVSFYGGYTDNFTARSTDPSLTIFDAASLNIAPYSQWIQPNTNVTVDGFTFQNSANSSSSEVGASLAIVVADGQISVSNNTIKGNSIDSQGGAIGIVANGDNSSVSVVGNTFTNNEQIHTANAGIFGDGGGALLIYRGASVSVRDNSFNNNVAGGDGGALWIRDAADISVSNNTFDQNHSDSKGGAMYVRGNRGTTTIESNTITNNTSYESGGLQLITSDGNVVITGNIITGNSSTQMGGALYSSTSAGSGVNVYTQTISHNVITDNSSSKDGGGISLGASSFTVLDISNNLIANNTILPNDMDYDGNGGGIYAHLNFGDDVELNISSNTIVSNQADGNGGGVYIVNRRSGAEINLTNNIIYANKHELNGIAGDFMGSDMSIESDPEDYSLTLEGNDADLSSNGIAGKYSGVYVIDAPDSNYDNLDPLFKDATNGDYRLSAESSLINAGITLPSSEGNDLAGNARLLDGIIDVGAYEFNIVTDYTEIDAAGGGTITGTAGIDIITGGDLSITVFAGEGDDSIVGSTLSDVLNGEGGNDTITANTGSDYITGGLGFDQIHLIAESYWTNNYIAKNISNDFSIGTHEIFALSGYGRFSDVIDGGTGTDSLHLTISNDAFFLDDAISDFNNSVTLSSHSTGALSAARAVDIDTYFGGGGNDIIDLTSTNYLLANVVTLDGGAGNDILWASNGDDLLVGGDGNDTLCGAAGGDSLSGGTGQDTFQFTATSGNDLITDFSFVELDALEFYYRSNNPSNIDDLDLSNGVITWNSGDESRLVQIDLSATVQSSDINDFSDLISFHEIV
jgi:hypothetical protein